MNKIHFVYLPALDAIKAKAVEAIKVRATWACETGRYELRSRTKTKAVLILLNEKNLLDPICWKIEIKKTYHSINLLSILCSNKSNEMSKKMRHISYVYLIVSNRMILNRWKKVTWTNGDNSKLVSMCQLYYVGAVSKRLILVYVFEL